MSKAWDETWITINRNHDKDWERLRNYIRYELNQVMLSMPYGGTIVRQCPQCRYNVPFQVEKVYAVEQIIDVVMEHIKRFHNELADLYNQVADSKGLEIELTPVQQAINRVLGEG